MNLKTFPLLAAVLLAVGVAGCAPDLSSLELRMLCAPSADCTFKSTCDLQYLGTYSVAAGTSLRVFIEVANQTPTNEDLSAGRVNSNDAHVTGATIELSGASTGTATPILSNQVVPAGGTAVIGVSIPVGSTAGLVMSKIRLLGYYDNGREFETGDFPLDFVVKTSGTLGSCATAGDVVTCPPPPVTPASATLYQTPSACGTP